MRSTKLIQTSIDSDSRPQNGKNNRILWRLEEFRTNVSCWHGRIRLPAPSLPCKVPKFEVSLQARSTRRWIPKRVGNTPGWVPAASRKLHQDLCLAYQEPDTELWVVYSVDRTWKRTHQSRKNDHFVVINCCCKKGKGWSTPFLKSCQFLLCTWTKSPTANWCPDPDG